VIKESAVIRKRGNNWRVIVYAGRDPLSGRKRQKTGTAKTKAEAKQLEARLITEAATGRHRSAGTKTVAELVEAWYQWRQGVRPISPNTLANYRRYIWTRRSSRRLARSRLAAWTRPRSIAST
jgi:hypothetical protein